MNLTTTSSWRQFSDLIATNDGEQKGLPCGMARQHLLVKGKDGEPILFLNSEPRRHPRAPVRLMNVVGEFDRRYSLNSETDQDSVVGCFTTFRCVPEAVELHPYFVEMMVAIADLQPAPLSEAEVDKVVDSLVELFKTGSPPAHSTIAGLWGELLIIAMSSNPDSFVAAWHTDTSDSFDFAFSDRRIEVKSSEKQCREHEFSLGQVFEQRDGDFVASILLKRSAAGLSVLGLAEQVAKTLDDSHRIKFWGLVFRTLGDDSLLTEDVRYDFEYAKDMLRFVHSRCIPAPVVGPTGLKVITHVRYRANIESVVQEAGMLELS